MYHINNCGNTDPCVNLALEEYAVRQLDRRKSYVLLYVNQPSLIIGKHQNIPEEVNLHAAQRLNIPVIRRISGGGTVFHDTGNLNFSFITRQTLKNFNQYSNFLKPIIEALRDLGLNVSKDKRNNLLNNGSKISGNAQFSSRGRLLCHGTLLFHSELEILDRVIRHKKSDLISSKSAKSIRSAVTNILDYLPVSVSLNDLKHVVLDKIFKGSVKEHELTDRDWQNVHRLADEKYRSWDWNYGLSPKSKFEVQIPGEPVNSQMTLFLEYGKIADLFFTNDFISKNITDKLRELIIGRRFDSENLLELISDLKQPEYASESANALKMALSRI